MKKNVFENYFPEFDEFSREHLDDLGGDEKRKFADAIDAEKAPKFEKRARLTFKHLNRMRKIREVKKLEAAAHRQFVKTMYGTKADDEGLGF